LILIMDVLTKRSSRLYNKKDSNTSIQLSELKIVYSDTINDVAIDKEYLEIFTSFIDKIKSKTNKIEVAHPKFDEKKAYLEYWKVVGFEMGVNNPRIPFMSRFLFLFLLLKYRDYSWAKGMAIGQRASNFTYE